MAMFNRISMSMAIFNSKFQQITRGYHRFVHAFAAVLSLIFGHGPNALRLAGIEQGQQGRAPAIDGFVVVDN